jgi:mannosyl-oligosaccharide alpha-1,2-mannosidase
MASAVRRLGFTGWRTGFFYFGSVFSDHFSHEVSHVDFFLPGLLFLAARDGVPEHRAEYLALAKELLRTAVSLYMKQPTKLGGEVARFISKKPGVQWVDDTFKLRPELVESLFYAWRVTHSVRARETAWTIFLAIRKYCKVWSGFTSVRDTSDTTVVYEDLQDSFFLSETLKYLYLIFAEDDVYSLDEYVFSTQAHPFRRL